MSGGDGDDTLMILELCIITKKIVRGVPCHGHCMSSRIKCPDQDGVIHPFNLFHSLRELYNTCNHFSPFA